MKETLLSSYQEGDTLVRTPTLDQFDCKLTKYDISKAVSWFEKETVEQVNSITLNPQYKGLCDDDRIRFSSGCLAWEIWLSAEAVERKISPITSEKVKIPAENHKEVLTRTKSENNRALQNLARPPVLSLGGRPRKNVPVDRIKELSKEGMGVRDISRKLKITPSMVSRVLSGQR